ncbi:hypothetical protein [Citrobacter phage Ci1]|nr:hypothetical protein [Citrobacter phage Ci1]
MKGVEFDEIFKPKAQEFCQILGSVARNKGYVVHSVDIKKFDDFIYIFNLLVSAVGVRSLPEQLVYTVYYNPKTDKYTWHENFPYRKKERVLN